MVRGCMVAGVLLLFMIVLLGGCSMMPGNKAGESAYGTGKNAVPVETVITPDTGTATRGTEFVVAAVSAPAGTVTTPVPVYRIPNWSCSDWSACNRSGFQDRSCTDLNTTGSTAGQPAVLRSCTYKPSLPSPGPYTVSITGDMLCRQTAEKAVTNLKYRASGDYEYFRKYVGAINCSFSDMCYASMLRQGEAPVYTVCIASLADPPTVYIDGPLWDADPLWLAGVLVHEACHSEGYQEYILKEGANYDLTEFSDWKFERRCCDRMRTTWNQLGAPSFNYDLYRFCNL
ncbi:MAG: hypothetical protein A4E35_00869 [Methanoregula sp. PtaU1.Bin051]|nr:MAG: hypothetical protein A4E35_00869 [Methanoregula sp. PtaU1.Bin051]